MEASENDLQVVLALINLPNLLNCLIAQESYAKAVQLICHYHVKMRPQITSADTPKLLKLVDKEVIGVLQQKLVKLLALRLQSSFLLSEEDAEAMGSSSYGGEPATRRLLIMLKNLLKASPPEAPIHTELQYKSLDEYNMAMLLSARELFLRRLTCKNAFDQFKDEAADVPNKAPDEILVDVTVKNYQEKLESFRLIEKCLKPYLRHLKAIITEVIQLGSSFFAKKTDEKGSLPAFARVMLDQWLL